MHCTIDLMYKNVDGTQSVHRAETKSVIFTSTWTLILNKGVEKKSLFFLSLQFNTFSTETLLDLIKHIQAEHFFNYPSIPSTQVSQDKLHNLYATWRVCHEKKVQQFCSTATHNYRAVQVGLLIPLTFNWHCLSPLAAFTSSGYFLLNGRR